MFREYHFRQCLGSNLSDSVYGVPFQTVFREYHLRQYLGSNLSDSVQEVPFETVFKEYPLRQCCLPCGKTSNKTRTRNIIPHRLSIFSHRKKSCNVLVSREKGIVIKILTRKPGLKISFKSKQ